ncbi:hypothetical protein C8R47DRAFT_1245409 [Mycena vitilis]|nr:hypothetical protein C8R47DRAFT_1245409 [Mycena vitilis]
MCEMLDGFPKSCCSVFSPYKPCLNPNRPDLMRLQNSGRNKNHARDMFFSAASQTERATCWQELETFMDTLPLGSRAQFLEDPLGPGSTSQPIVLHYQSSWTNGCGADAKWVVFDAGLADQKEAHPEKEQSKPGRYTVSFRNAAEKERHIEELKAQAADEDLGIWDWQRVLTEQVVKELSLTPPTRYSTTLSPVILEWVKSRDEVINIEPEPVARYETPASGIASTDPRKSKRTNPLKEGKPALSSSRPTTHPRKGKRKGASSHHALEPPRYERGEYFPARERGGSGGAALAEGVGVHEALDEGGDAVEDEFSVLRLCQRRGWVELEADEEYSLRF